MLPKPVWLLQERQPMAGCFKRSVLKTLGCRIQRVIVHGTGFNLGPYLDHLWGSVAGSDLCEVLVSWVGFSNWSDTVLKNLWVFFGSTPFSAGWQKIRSQRSSLKSSMTEWRWPSKKSRQRWQWTPVTWEIKRKMMRQTGMPHQGKKVNAPLHEALLSAGSWAPEKSHVSCSFFFTSRLQTVFWLGFSEEGN